MKNQILYIFFLKASHRSVPDKMAMISIPSMARYQGVTVLTRQFYHLFQDLWYRFNILGSGCKVPLMPSFIWEIGDIYRWF